MYQTSFSICVYPRYLCHQCSILIGFFLLPKGCPPDRSHSGMPLAQYSPVEIAPSLMKCFRASNFTGQASHFTPIQSFFTTGQAGQALFQFSIIPLSAIPPFHLIPTHLPDEPYFFSIEIQTSIKEFSFLHQVQSRPQQHMHYQFPQFD